MNTMERIEGTLKPGTFSDKIWGLDSIQLIGGRKNKRKRLSVVIPFDDV